MDVAADGRRLLGPTSRQGRDVRQCVPAPERSAACRVPGGRTRGSAPRGSRCWTARRPPPRGSRPGGPPDIGHELTLPVVAIGGAHALEQDLEGRVGGGLDVVADAAGLRTQGSELPGAFARVANPRAEDRDEWLALGIPGNGALEGELVGDDPWSSSSRRRTSGTASPRIAEPTPVHLVERDEGSGKRVTTPKCRRRPAAPRAARARSGSSTRTTRPSAATTSAPNSASHPKPAGRGGS